jgi:hypothetical protein
MTEGLWPFTMKPDAVGLSRFLRRAKSTYVNTDRRCDPE